MSFFKQFPLREYRLPDNSRAIVTDIFRHVGINDILSDNLINYTYYEIEEGDRPDVVSQKLYGTTDYYWTFFIINDHLKKGLMDWPKEPITQQKSLEQEFSNYGANVAIPEQNSPFILFDGSSFANQRNIENTFSEIDWSYSKARVRRNGAYADVVHYDHNNLQLVVSNFNDSPADTGSNSPAKVLFFAGDSPGQHDVRIAFSDGIETSHPYISETGRAPLVGTVDESKFRFVEGLVNKRTESLENFYPGATSLSDYANFDGVDTRATTLQHGRTTPIGTIAANSDGVFMQDKYPTVIKNLTADDIRTYLGSGFTIELKFTYNDGTTGWQTESGSNSQFRTLLSFGTAFNEAAALVIGIDGETDQLRCTFGWNYVLNSNMRTLSRFSTDDVPKFFDGHTYTVKVQYDGIGTNPDETEPDAFKVHINGKLAQSGGWTQGIPRGEIMNANTSTFSITAYNNNVNYRPGEYLTTFTEEGTAVSVEQFRGVLPSRQGCVFAIGCSTRTPGGRLPRFSNTDDSPIVYSETADGRGDVLFPFSGRIYYVHINGVTGEKGTGFAEYNFNEGAGNILYDRSGNGNHLLIQPGTAKGSVTSLAHFWAAGDFHPLNAPNLHKNIFNTKVAANGSPTATQVLFEGDNSSAATAGRNVNISVTPKRTYSNFLEAPAYYHLDGDSPDGTILNAYDAHLQGRLDDFTSNFLAQDAQVENNRKIKVVKPALIDQFAREYKQIIGTI